MRRSTKTSAAFTLVEVLVASAVAVLIAAAVAAALIAAFGSFSRAAADPEAERSLGRLDAFETLRADLACAAPLGGIAFSGAEDGFSCARLLSMRRTPGDTAVVRVEWAASPNGGCVRTVTRAGATLSETRWDPSFGPLRLSYARLAPVAATGAVPASTGAVPAGGGRPSGPPQETWSDAWAGPGLPDLVRMRWGGTEAEIAPACATEPPEGRP